MAGIVSGGRRRRLWVWDAHGPGSIDVSASRGAVAEQRPGAYVRVFDASFDALFFLGQHSKAGTLNGNLAHSYSSLSIERLCINGIELGEFQPGGVCRDVGRADGVCERRHDDGGGQGIVPGIYGAQVKVGLGPQIALHLAPEDARDVIRSVAAEATAHAGDIAPYTIPGPPYEQEIIIWARTDPTSYLSRGFEQTGARTFVKRADRLDALMI